MNDSYGNGKSDFERNIFQRQSKSNKRLLWLFNKTGYLSSTSWASLLVSNLTLDGGGVQQLQHVGAAQVVRGAAVLLAVARPAHNLAWKDDYLLNTNYFWFSSS
jgi:hypothetical protein